MRSPVVVTNTWSLTQADLLVARLRDQGIDAVARTNLDRTTYAGLGGAMVLVDAEQRLEAELELVLFESGNPADLPGGAGPDGVLLDGRLTDPTSDPAAPGIRPRRSWIRVGGYISLAAIVLGTAVPSLAVIWSQVVH